MDAKGKKRKPDDSKESRRFVESVAKLQASGAIKPNALNEFERTVGVIATRGHKAKPASGTKSARKRRSEG